MLYISVSRISCFEVMSVCGLAYQQSLRLIITVNQLYNQKNVLNIWSEHNYIFSHRLVHKTTCFGPVYWPSSGCIINLISSYTICAWGTVQGTRSRLTVVGGMASGSLWTGVNIICQCLSISFQTC
jgi:hypothetical protein